MFYEGTYKVKSVTRTGDGETFDASQHISSGLAKYRHIEDIEVPEGVDVEPGDVVHLRIENHSEESGGLDRRGANRKWALDSFHGFHYDEERSCAVCR